MTTHGLPPTHPVDHIEPIDPGEVKTLLGHPRGLYLLFMTEMWERFSYYGMRGLLILYLISVIGIHQLKPGVYQNTLVIDEFTQQDGSPDRISIGTQSRTMIIDVGDADMENITPAEASTGSPELRLIPLKDSGRVGDDGNPIWEPDPSQTSTTIVLEGEEGGDHDRKTRGFTNADVRYQLSNPTAEPIKVRVSIEPKDEKDEKDHTYFTVNEQVGTISLVVKPDSTLEGDDKPIELRVAPNTHDSGRNWTNARASVLYGWYNGLAYLFPIFGGIIADKLIGTHRSMLVGGLLIATGHVILGISGFGAMAQSTLGMSVFVMGLCTIVLGTGHFKPTVSVMVGQLYGPGDPRRDGAFTIFYMGINLGAFICAFICGTLGEKVGWHWGFGSAAVGMIAGLLVYMWGKPKYLAGIGDAPKANATSTASMFFIGSMVVSAAFATIYFLGAFAHVGEWMNELKKHEVLSLGLVLGGLALVVGAAGWFVAIQDRGDKGPTASIFIFMLFNAFFWIAFEQAGSSINVFTQQNTDRMMFGFEIPATWFQSVNAGFILLLAPVFSGIWTWLGRHNKNPSQPVKIALGLIFLGFGYLFMVMAGRDAHQGAKAAMWLITMTYFWHTVGELCLSPTGLSYVTKAAPVKFVSLLMGIWFVSSFIANLGGGLVAAQVEKIENGEITVPWNFGGKADFFFLFVVTSIGAGVLILILTPLLKMMMRNPND